MGCCFQMMPHCFHGYIAINAAQICPFAECIREQATFSQIWIFSVQTRGCWCFSEYRARSHLSTRNVQTFSKKMGLWDGLMDGMLCLLLFFVIIVVPIIIFTKDYWGNAAIKENNVFFSIGCIIAKCCYLRFPPLMWAEWRNLHQEKPEYIYSNVAIDANPATAHFTNSQLIVKPYFKSHPPRRLHFLLTSSLIWCHADGCNCQMVFAGQPSHVESLSPVGGRGRRLMWVESAPLVLQSAATSLSDNCTERPVFIFMITLKQPSSAVRCLFFLPALKHHRHFTFSEPKGLSLKMSKTQLFLFTANFDTFVYSGK